MTTFDFLSPTSIRQHAAAGGLEQSIIAQLIALAEKIGADPTLQSCAQQLFAQTYQRAEITIEPSPETLLGAEANKLYLLLAVDAVRQLRVAQHARAVPVAITQEACGALLTAARRFAGIHGGQAGIEDWVLRHWFRTVASGNLYRLGRLEFIPDTFDGNVRVYRHRQSGRVQALAEDGVRFTADGYLPFEFDAETVRHYGWSHTKNIEDAWIATIIESKESVTGTPVTPAGYAIPATLRLAKTDWELVLRNGDTVLDMHIPNFMPLRLDLLHDSLRRALDFFPRYYAERPFKAFACSSWVFNTQLEEMLPAESNLLAFQRQGYLFPLPSDGADGLYFIFGEWLLDLENAPQDTQLRRAVVKHLRAGQKLRSGGFLLLPDEIERFGREPYRFGSIDGTMTDSRCTLWSPPSTSGNVTRC